MQTDLPPRIAARQFVLGFSWTMVVLSLWALLRSGIWCYSYFSDDAPASPMPGLSPTLFFVAVAFHAVIAITTLAAAFSLQKRQIWARNFFVGLLALLAIEAIGLGTYLLLHLPSRSDTGASLMGIKIAAGIALWLIAGIAAMVGWKLQRDKAIRQLFEAQP